MRNILLLLLIIISYTFLSQGPDVSVPDWNLDASYVWAINYFTATGAWARQELLFTFGPLGFLMKPQWYSFNIILSFLLQTCLSAGIGFIFVALVRERWRNSQIVGAISSSDSATMVVAAVVLLFMLHFLRVLPFQDKLLLLLLGLVSLHYLLKAPWYYYGAGLVAVLALFVKSTFLVLLPPLAGYTLYALVRHRLSIRQTGIAALTVLSLYLITALAFFQDFRMLYLFPRAYYEFALGNQSAMSYSDAPFPMSWTYFWLFWLVLLALVAAVERELRPVYIVSLLVPGYLMFRYAMARYDHAYEWFSFMIAGFFFFIPLSRRPLLTVPLSLLSTLLLFLFLSPSPAGGRIRLQVLELLSIHRTIVPPVNEVIAGWMKVRDRPHLSPSEIRTIDVPLSPPVSQKLENETVDIYPREVGRAFFYGLHWTPRPVFQSYLAYRPWLAERNVDFFRDQKRSPQYILWHSSGPAKSLISIDDRYLLNDEIPTFLEIVKQYEPDEILSSGFLLRRRDSPRILRDEDGERGVTRALNATNITLGEDMQQTPRKGDFCVGKFDIRRSLEGTLIRYLYKESMVTLVYRLENGRVILHRVAPDMLFSAGVWVNPYIETDTQLVNFLRRTGGAGSRVESIGILFEKQNHYEANIPFEFRCYTIQ
jgi:hypothetical protein